MEQIVAKLKQRRPDLDGQGLRAISADLYYSGEWENVIASDSAVDKLIKSYQNRTQADATRRVAANDPTRCPICKTELKPVKLDSDRDAVWCSKHFVVFPVKKAKSNE